MNTASIESSLYKYLYTNLELTDNIKIFENTGYLNFDTYTKWVAIDQLSNTVGALPKALYFLHIAVKDGQQNEAQVLNRLVDKVVDVVYRGLRIDVYDDASGNLVGEMELSQSSLSPVVKHPSGGSYRSLTIGVVYAGPNDRM